MQKSQQTILPPSHFTQPMTPHAASHSAPMPAPRGMQMAAVLSGLVRNSFLLVVLAMAAEFFMPYDLKPSTMMGRFSGAVDTAEINASADAKIGYEQRIKTLEAEIQRTNQAYEALYQRSNVVVQYAMQMEQLAMQARQQAVAGAQGMKNFSANLADLGCTLSFLDSSGNLSRSACAAGNKIRKGMADEISGVGSAESGEILKKFFSGLPDPATLRVSGAQ